MLDNRKHWSGLSHSGLAQVALKGHSIPGYRALWDWGVWFRLGETRSVGRVRTMTCHQNHKDAHTVTAAKPDQYLHFNQAVSQSQMGQQCCLYCMHGGSKHIWTYSLHFLYLVSGWCVCFICLLLYLQVWSLKLEQEVEKNKALTEALQTLATEHHELKQSLYKSRRSSTLTTLTEDDFFDAVSGQQPLDGQLVK